MARKPTSEMLAKAHCRASAIANACGLKLLQARQAGDREAAKANRRKLEFWMRRIARIARKKEVARQAH